MKLALQFSCILIVVICGSKSAVNGEEDQNVNVVDGTPAAEGELPYQINMYDRTTRSWCGGTIYNNLNIITAAHCVFNRQGQQINAADVTVYAGSTRIREGVSVGVSWIYPHGQYNPRTFHNDIAIMRLAEPLPEDNENIQSLRMAPEGFKPRGSCLVSGWGSIGGDNRETSDDLLKADLKITTNCRDDQKQFICAGGNGRNACFGDSGGPLACKANDGKSVLAGVVSHGPQNCGSGAGVFTRVTTQLQWIKWVVSN